MYAEDAPLELRTVSTVRILRWVWLQNYVNHQTGVRWRATDDGLPTRHALHQFAPRRLISIGRQAGFEALRTARQRQQTSEFAAIYVRAPFWH